MKMMNIANLMNVMNVMMNIMNMVKIDSFIHRKQLMNPNWQSSKSVHINNLNKSSSEYEFSESYFHDKNFILNNEWCIIKKHIYLVY